MNGIHILFIVIITVLRTSLTSGHFKGIDRPRCKNSEGHPIKAHSDTRSRVYALRRLMAHRNPNQALSAYIVSSFDDHQNLDVADCDKRREYISGFSGLRADVVITQKSLALWTTERYLAQANSELDCDWTIFDMQNYPSITDWIGSELPPDSRVGADPQTIPHFLWSKYDTHLHRKLIRLVKVSRNLVDEIWTAKPIPFNGEIFVQPLYHSGEKWQTKIMSLRLRMVETRSDAIIITSLTEISYLLNLRSNDLAHTPVFKAYMIVSHNETLLYVDKTRINLGIKLHLKAEPCFTGDICIKIRDYYAVWHDIKSYSHHWHNVIVPSQCAFDMGASESIYSSLPKDIIQNIVSPVIFMRAQKNDIEREGMRKAHIIDGLAMCETLHYLEQKFKAGHKLTESSVSKIVDYFRTGQPSNKGLSMKTIVSYGRHSSIPHFEIFNTTDIEIGDDSVIVIESGGQYQEGTTKITRTLHFGTPTAEQKTAYTNVLRGIIRLSTLVFPDKLKTSEVDALTRVPVWGAHYDYPLSTGHGIGSFLSVKESPINIDYSAIEDAMLTFKAGYFFSN
ncbi:Xaa-Pro aminopeptidase 1, partial [Pseudolycoriella hygida]